MLIVSFTVPKNGIYSKTTYHTPLLGRKLSGDNATLTSQIRTL